MNELTVLAAWIEPVSCVLGLMFIVRAGQLGRYRWLAGLLTARFVSYCLLYPLLFWHKELHLTVRQTYIPYFYIYWSSETIEAVLGFGVILSIYRLAMAPFEGLQRLGMIMFRWAGFISAAIALSIAVGPHIDNNSFIVRSVSQLQQSQCVLTLCMLIFVCFAIHPMGLSFKSRIFGVCLGLGLMAATQLVSAAWLFHMPSLHSYASAIDSLAVCMTFFIWGFYFLKPEPARKMILVPITSPFFHWNEISKVLGDEPGFVAVGPVTLDNFAPAELEIMLRASDKMKSMANPVPA